MKKRVIASLKSALEKLDINLSEEELNSMVEIPQNTEMGDFAFPCFQLARQKKMPPFEIALQIRKEIGNAPEGFQSVQTQGPYINFFLDRKAVALNLIAEIKKQKQNFGKNIQGKGQITMIESPSPNSNKPLHIGHLRNMSLGESVARILESNGEKLIRANLNNDRGAHICKSMLAYQKWGKNKKPSKKLKSDKLVGDFYVLFAKKSTDKLEHDAHEMLAKWEQGDKEVVALWKKITKWALDGQKETYKKFGITHDKEYFESEIYDKGKDIVLEGVKNKVFIQEEDGAVYVDLTNEKLDKKYLLRSDGTTIYMTQDIYLAKKKLEEFKLTKSIYLTGNEQNYHFQALFSILEKLGFSEKEKLFHLSYGMLSLPGGKIKSREGKTADADDIIEEVQKLAAKELSSRGKLSKKELEKRSLVVALAAIKYWLLKLDRKKDTVFNPKESLNFEGDTGPYLLYSYARANSILKKAKPKQKKILLGELEKSEIELISKLNSFPELVEKAYRTLNPAVIANYSFELAQIFNEFYHACPVIGSEKEFFRLRLVECFKQVLSNSLTLLGIETLEKM